MNPKKQTTDTPPKKVLIVDDEALIRFGLEKFISNEGYTPITAGSGQKALEMIENHNPDIALLDLNLRDSIDGLELLRVIKESRPEIEAIMISGQSEIHGAVEAMKLGARDYLEKPIDFDQLKERLDLIRQEESKNESPPAPADAGLEEHPQIVCEKMRKVMTIARRLALKSDLTILVLGESGTGKNYLCQQIHSMSSRRDAPYVQIGCSNMPDSLIESELFGYEKGAFTDAKTAKKGLLAAAQGGTILLDELGDMPYSFQTKILKLLEERTYRRVGSLQDIQADIRILAATNRNLNKKVQNKEFRLDLYYRLNIATLELPPLRERLEDFPFLVEYFLKTFTKKYDTGPRTIDRDGMELLMQHPWPGNVRQLKNLVEKLVVLSEESAISPAEITDNLDMFQDIGTLPSAPSPEPVQPPVTQAPPPPAPAPTPAPEPEPEDLSLEAMEERFIKKALRKTGGNQRKAAKLLNISRDALRYRLKKMNYSFENEIG